VDLLLDTEEKSLLHENAVQIIEMSAMLGLTDPLRKLGIIHFDRPHSVENQGFHLGFGDEVLDFLEKAFGQHQPIEGFTVNEVYEPPPVVDLGRDPPPSDGINESDEPVLTVDNVLAEPEDGVVLGRRPGFGRVQDLDLRCFRFGAHTD